MYFRLILFQFIFIPVSWGISPQETLHFSKSKEWKKLFYFNGENSQINSKAYFIHPEGHKNLYAELKSNIKAFQINSKDPRGEYYQCLFPARFDLINKRWPQEFKKRQCKVFQEWFQGLDAQDIYLVFASSYPNNPSSMFGHTFLKTTRKSKGALKSTQQLLGYSLAFQARTNPNDNAFFYSIKGLTGGYNAHLDIEPYYINVGVYNNSESRDLWEYKLNFSNEQKEKLIKHAWELHHSGSFEYYFFDENCSSLLVKMLEAVIPEINFPSKDELFVVPQVTLRETVGKLGTKEILYRPSLKKQLNQRLKKLNNKQMTLFHAGREGSLENISDIDVLDALVFHWKLKNYKKQTLLDKNENKIMFQTQIKRASLQKRTIFSVIPPKKIERPHLGHRLSRYSMALGKDIAQIKFRYGFHNFFDSEWGYDQQSHVDFLNITYQEYRGEEFWAVTLFDILSLQNFSFHFPNLSWRLKSQLQKDYTDFGFVDFGIGLSQNFYRLQVFLLGTLGGHAEKGLEATFGWNFGAKYFLTESWKIVLESKGFNYSSGDYDSFETRLIYQKETIQLSLNYIKRKKRDYGALEVGFYY